VFVRAEIHYCYSCDAHRILVDTLPIIVLYMRVDFTTSPKKITRRLKPTRTARFAMTVYMYCPDMRPDSGPNFSLSRFQQNLCLYSASKFVYPFERIY